MEQSELAVDDDRKSLRKLLTIVTCFRDLDSDMPIQQLQVFFWIALNEGKTQRDLRTQLNMPSSTASRNIAALSEVHRLGKAGLGLVDFVEDAKDRRAKKLHLTNKGRYHLQKVINVL